MHTRPHTHRRFPAAPSTAARGKDLEETLSSLSDRTELEGLFDRKVELSQLLRLAGRGVGRETIRGLLREPDPSRALRKLLDS